MDLGDHNRRFRLVGDYILGPRIGWGSFAVVWRSRHRYSGAEVAVKEIDRTQLSPKVSENLLKEISILSTINNPNIIRLFEVIETEDRIYLVLEYCDRGDLAAYIQRHGKVSEADARHFMRQLAAGLQILHEKHLIHRDLKPQNLLLSTREATLILKIGDFGFARSLMPQGLADTLCGSPLYMAPEIIQNQKYDAKADLWSVGAILFQLVTGKPPFDGNSHLQLFQNILTSTELQFPQGSLEEIHPDCVDLVRSLLRQNPVERLTFKDFFNHKFLREPRPNVEVEYFSPLQPMKSMDGNFNSVHPTSSYGRNPTLITSLHDNILKQVEYGDNSSIINSGHGFTPNISSHRMGKSVDEGCSSDQRPVSDSVESIEKDYVLVNAPFASMEGFSYSLETSLQDKSTSRVSLYPSRKNDLDIAVAMQKMELADSSVGGPESAQSHGSDLLVTSNASSTLREAQRLTILHPSTKLHLLHHYLEALAELSQEKYDAGLFLESLSVELVVLAIWKKSLQICSSWLTSTTEGELPATSSTNDFIPYLEGAGSSSNSGKHIDFSKPSSVSLWAEQGFLSAFDRAEKSSSHIRDMDGAAEMPDTMEIIYQKALAIATNAAVDEYMKNKERAAALYSKALLLLSFIVREATCLPLNPPFSLTDADKKRIQQYIINLQSHQSRCLVSQDPHKQSLPPPRGK
ncbi:serine/threonine-protein kinase ATG1a isoform X2 [Juglans microcarpa x Juglans regia]|uniref:serine/threonine-protein kinase ATG1a isoform X2 n=1 Tax=Juglans microcarpa x Juglans regia TaxID=2249226 RepID=UPI001B7E3E79|nr:serine/threonine-protein kinase ATG1a isoform X2 [Juglans microcarpa x Juglans regia]